MRNDLDALKTEIEVAIRDAGFALFHGLDRGDDPLPTIRWDTLHYPDPRDFLTVASKAGAKLIVFHHREFNRGSVEDAIDDLQAIDLPRDDQREMEKRLRKLMDYEGFTCIIEMSFECETTVYSYETITPWYDEFLSILEQIQDLLEGSGEDTDNGSEPGPMGFFSKN